MFWNITKNFAKKDKMLSSYHNVCIVWKGGFSGILKTSEISINPSKIEKWTTEQTVIVKERGVEKAVRPLNCFDCIKSPRFCAQRWSDVGSGTSQDWGELGRRVFYLSSSKLSIHVTKNGVIYIYFEFFEGVGDQIKI